MHCPYCGKQVSDTVNICGYCGRDLRQPKPLPPQTPTPQPTQVIIQSSMSEGLLSHLTGLFNFSMAALLIALIIFITLVLLCVIRLPSSFPIIDLPPQLDTLWSRAVTVQSQICDGGQPETYQPPG